VITVFLPLVSANGANATPTDAGKNEFASANYWIKIDPVGDHSIGNVFIINGTTNLPVTENLTMFISGVFRSAQKTSPMRDSRMVIINNIPILPTPTIPDGMNRWSINVTDTVQKNLIVDDYDVGVVSSRDDITALTSSSIESQYGIFHLFPAKNETISTVLQTATQIPSQIQPTPSTTPFITIDPIGNHTVGDIFFINGTTNLPVSYNQNLYLTIHPDNSLPRQLEYFKNLPITSGSNGINQWSDNVTDLDWKPMGYEATIISSENPLVENTQNFRIQPAASPISIQPTLSQIIVPTTTQSSPLPVALPIVVLVIMAVLKLVLKEK
jgi:hypothetical protein